MLQDIADNGIKIYQFPDAHLDEEDDAANQKLRVSHTYTIYLQLMCVCVCVLQLRSILSDLQ